MKRQAGLWIAAFGLVLFVGSAGTCFLGGGPEHAQMALGMLASLAIGVFVLGITLRER